MPVLDNFAVVSGVLSADVANAGTFTIGYPTGFRLGDFRSGKEHKMVVAQKVYSCPADFTLTYTSSTVITVTNNSGTTLRQGSTFRIQLDVGGVDIVPGVENTMYASVVRVNLGAPITADTDGIATTELLGAAGDIPIDGVQASGGVATLDVARNVTLTTVTTNHSALTLTVYGTDEYGATLVEAIAGPNNNTVAGKKAFKTVTRVASSGAIATNGISVGFGDVLGLPVFTPATAILKEIEDGTAPSAGTLVAGLSPLTESTSTTADVRGTYDPNSACNGAKVFELDLILLDPTFLGNPQFAG